VVQGPEDGHVLLEAQGAAPAAAVHH